MTSKKKSYTFTESESTETIGVLDQLRKLAKKDNNRSLASYIAIVFRNHIEDNK